MMRWAASLLLSLSTVIVVMSLLRYRDATRMHLQAHEILLQAQKQMVFANEAVAEAVRLLDNVSAWVEDRKADG